jgi:predicted  nucleic acid-binding Zn-ribbon protein
MNITGSSVQDSQNESIGALNGDAKTVEDGLQALWAVARKAGEELQRLRRENEDLSGQVRAREAEITEIRKQVHAQQELLRKLQEQQQNAEASVALNGDRQMLYARVKALLAKIDAYL